MKTPDLRKPLSTQHEANAMMNYAFARGLLRVSLLSQHSFDTEEMMKLWIDVSIAVGDLFNMRKKSPSEYAEFMQNQHQDHCKHWDKLVATRRNEINNAQHSHMALSRSR